MIPTLTKNDLSQLMPYLNGVVHIDIKLLKNKGSFKKQIILEYSDGTKSVGFLDGSPIKFNKFNKLTSFQEYVSRGIDGQSSYRGNCPGQIIEQFIRYVQSKTEQNIFFADPMCGSNTSSDVCKRLGISHWCNDLRYGFNALGDMPRNANAIWCHPPYYVGKRKNGSLSSMPRYSGVQWGKNINMNDGSHIHNYESYITWLNHIQASLYMQLRNNGYLGLLIGASKVDGSYFDPLIDMNFYGKIESIVIKKQNNCLSDSTEYSKTPFIAIEHEYLIVIKKEQTLMIPCKVTRNLEVSIMNSIKITWKCLISSIIESMNGSATIDQLYSVLKNHPKSQNNNFLREKIRQTLNYFKDEFCKVGNIYFLSSFSQQSIALP